MAVTIDSDLDLFCRHLDDALQGHHTIFLDTLTNLNRSVDELVFLVREDIDEKRSGVYEAIGKKYPGGVERSGETCPDDMKRSVETLSCAIAETFESSHKKKVGEAMRKQFSIRYGKKQSPNVGSEETIKSSNLNSSGETLKTPDFGSRDVLFESENSLVSYTPRKNRHSRLLFDDDDVKLPSARSSRIQQSQQPVETASKSLLYRFVAGTRKRSESFLSENTKQGVESEPCSPKERKAIKVNATTTSRYSQMRSPSLATINPTRARTLLKEVVNSDKFDALSMIMITLNGIFVGVHTEFYSATNKDDMPTPIVVMEWIFCIFFFVELVMRLLVFRSKFFYNSNWAWNIGDLLIVAMSVWELMMVTFGDSEKSGTFSMVRLIRILRMFRVMRMIRVIHFFREFRILTVAILNALKSLVWALLLLVFIMYVVACVITSGVASRPELHEFEFSSLRKYWSTIGRSIFTLFMVIFDGANWEDVADPMHRVGAFYVYVLIFYVAFVKLAVLNVITGVFCENAIKSATRDDEEVMREQMRLKEAYVIRLMKLFEDCKSTELGQITLKDFEQRMEDEQIKAYFNMIDLAVDDGRTLFKLLDVENKGLLNLDEFVSGCLQLKGVAKSVDMAQLYRKINCVEQQVHDVLKDLAEVKKSPSARTGNRQPSTTSTRNPGNAPGNAQLETLREYTSQEDRELTNSQVIMPQVENDVASVRSSLQSGEEVRELQSL